MSSCNSNASAFQQRNANYRYPVGITDLFQPPPAILLNAVKAELEKNFTSVSLEYAMCPDLRSLSLTAPGICGNTAIMEIGSLQYLFPRPQLYRKYCFKSLLLRFDRANEYNFIIGAGKHSYRSIYNHAELTANMLLAPFSSSAVMRHNYIYNKNHVTWWDKQKSQINYMQTRDSLCAIQGNFFLSNGSAGPVLTIRAANRYGQFDFVSCIQNGLTNSQRFRYELIGLGGVFTAYNSGILYHIMPSRSSCNVQNVNQIKNWMKFQRTNGNITAVGTITSGKFSCYKYYDNSAIHLAAITNQHFHSVTYNLGGHVYSEDTYLNFPRNMNYVGYFSLANVLYCIDSKQDDGTLPILNDFHYLASPNLY